MKTKTYNWEGKAVGELELQDRIFDVKVNEDLIHQVVVAQMANRRVAIADTKDRGEVRGGGKKPWKQKGTGRARHGSTRSPIWKGGGVVFGPTSDRNYTKRINKKMKTKALFMVLSDKLRQNKLLVVESFEALDKPSTKKMLGLIKAMKVDSSILLALDEKHEGVMLSAANVAQISLIASGALNVVDLLKNDVLITTAQGIEKMEATYKYEF